MQDTLRRPWDSFDAYLFDIDGTLIRSADRTHLLAFEHAMTSLAGREVTLAGVFVHGNVDIGILRDGFAKAGIGESEWRPRLLETCARMCEYVEARQRELQMEVLPGVVAVLQHLRARGAKLAVATGNLERIGRVKLDGAGLSPYFDFGGWSDTHESREAVFRAAVAEARHLCGAEAAVCVLGDTPYDVRAAHANGVPAVAVATGIYPADELERAKPEMLLGSFAELLSHR